MRGVGGVPAADHDHRVGRAGEIRSGGLAERRGLADGIHELDLARPVVDGIDDSVQGRFREGRLDDDAHAVAEGCVRHVLESGDDVRARGVAQGGDNLGMTGLAHDDDLVPIAPQPLHLDVDALDERTGRIDHLRADLPCALLLMRGDPMRPQDQGSSRRIIDARDDMSAHGFEAGDHAGIVDEGAEGEDFPFEGIDGVPRELECALDAIACTRMLRDPDLGHGYIFPGCSARRRSRSS